MNNKTSTTNTITKVTALFAFALLAAIEPAYAQGGLAKVNTFVDNILLLLRGISIAAVTIAIMWAGYKFLFKHADVAEVGKILAGGLFIGGASELAQWLIG
jgi:type IV secretion system protein VirB2/type IV secretion system protein PtlA